MFKAKIWVISREIRPLAALYPPPPYKKVLYRAAISSFALSGRRGRYAHAYGICTSFYCISLNAARGLISRDIAGYSYLYIKISKPAFKTGIWYMTTIRICLGRYRILNGYCVSKKRCKIWVFITFGVQRDIL